MFARPLLLTSLLAAPLAAQWRTLEPVPFEARPLQAFVVRERAVVVGTAWTRDPETCRVAVLDPDRRWRAVDPPPLSSRCQPLLRVVGDRLLQFGGHEYKTERWCTDGAMLDPATGRWTKLAACPIAGRQLAAVADDGARLAIVAGTADSYRRVGDSYRSDANPQLDGAVFDVAANRWQLLPALPVRPRAAAQLTFVDDRLVLWGGWQPGAEGRVTPLGDGAILALGDASWRALPQAPAEFGSMPAAIGHADGHVLVFARSLGWIAKGARLDLDRLTWTALPPRDDFGISPGICHAHGEHLFVYSGRLGVRSIAAHDAWWWQPQAATWAKVPLPDGFAPRETPGVANSGEHLAILGGARNTALTVVDGPAPPQPDLGKCHGDGIVVDVDTGSLQYVPAGPLGVMEQPALAFWRGELLVVGGHRDQRKWLSGAATFAMAK